MEKDIKIRGLRSKDIIVDEVQVGQTVPLEYVAIANRGLVGSELFVTATAALEVEALAEVSVPDPEDENEIEKDPN